MHQQNINPNHLESNIAAYVLPKVLPFRWQKTLGARTNAHSAPHPAGWKARKGWAEAWKNSCSPPIFTPLSRIKNPNLYLLSQSQSGNERPHGCADSINYQWSFQYRNFGAEKNANHCQALMI